MSKIPELMSGRKLEHDALTTGQFISFGSAYLNLFSDFVGSTGDFTGTRTGSNASAALIPAVADGVMGLTHTTDPEAQAAMISTNGAGLISPTKEPIFEARVKITLATDSVFDADSNYLVFVGLASGGLSVGTGPTLISDTNDNVGFQLGSDSGTLSIFCESDDGTTDNDLKDSGIDFVSGTYVTLKIDMTDLSNVRFFVDGAEANNGNTFNMSDIEAADLLEPYILFSRTSASGTERAHRLDVDYIKCIWKRS